MKEFIHTQNLGEISFLNAPIFDGKFIKACFFGEKPEKGSIIMSHAFRTTNYMRMFEVHEVLVNRDAKTHSDCSRNPDKAYFELSVADVTNDDRFVNVDCSIQRLQRIKQQS